MIGNVNNYIGAMNGINSRNSVSAPSPVFDYKAAQQQTKSILDEFQAGNKQIKTLKDDSANFLNQYTNSMTNLSEAATKVSGTNLDKLLYDKEGKVTDETVKATVGAVQNMVDQYNDSLKMLNKNAERGSGVMDQITRMAGDPAPMASMKMVGVSVNKDGTLALDSAVMTKALKSENPEQVKLYKDIIGSSTGIAGGVQNDARAGLRTSAGKLIGNDLAQMQAIKQDDPLRSFASYARGGAFQLNNMMATGILMNMLV